MEQQSFNTAIMKTNEISVLSPFVGTLPLKSETTTAINGVADFNKN
jgi:hypothetical protein